MDFFNDDYTCLTMSKDEFKMIPLEIMNHSFFSRNSQSRFFQRTINYNPMIDNNASAQPKLPQFSNYRNLIQQHMKQELFDD